MVNSNDNSVVVTTENNNGVVTPLDELNIEIKKKDQLIQCFYNIASMDNDIRIESISTLIEILSDIQKTFKPEDHKDISRIVSKVVDKTEIFNVKFSPELNYTLKRLVVGLASTRDSARIGFSLALSELLHTFRQIELPWFFDFLAYHMDLSGKNLTEKESHFGRLFGMMSIIKSSRLEGLPIVQSAPSKSINYNFNHPISENIIECIVEQLLYISRKKVIYSELSFEILSSLLDQMTDSNFDKLWPFIKPIIPQSQNDYSPDVLSLLLLIINKFKKFNLIKQTSGWKHSSILNISNLPLLKNAYSESCKSHPRIHKLWRISFEILLADHSDNATLVEFWKIMVEDNLFKSSPNKKYLGLQLFEMLLPLVHPDIIVDIFSNNVILNLGESLKPTSPLHEVGTLAFQCIPKTAEISNQHRLALVLFFSSNPHQQQFEASVSVDVINELIGELDEESIKQYLQSLYKNYMEPKKSQEQEQNGTISTGAATTSTSTAIDQDDMVIDDMSNEERQEKFIESSRFWVLSQIGHIIKDIVKRPIEKIITLESTLLELLQFLYFNSYYLPAQQQEEQPAKGKGKAKQQQQQPKAKSFIDTLYSTKPVPELSQPVRDQSFIRFCSVLEELSYITLEPSKKGETTYEGSMSDGQFWATELATFQYELLKKIGDATKPQLSTFIPMGSKPVDKIMKVVQSIQAKQSASEKKINQLVGFELLFVHVSLQYLSDPTEISDIIDDLTSAFEDLTNPKKKPISTKKRSAPEDEKPLPFMVLLDVLISLLDNPIHILRTIIKQIFTIFTDNISFQVLEHILTMIKAPTEELFNGLDGDDADQDGDDDDEFQPITPEELEKSKAKLAKQDQDDEEEEEEDADEQEGAEEEEEEEEMEEDSDDDDDDDAVNPELVARLKKTMGHHLLFDDDEEDEDLLEPTENEARLIDNYLKEVFKNKKDKKSNYQDIKTQTINLKSRLIDLLETYIKKFTENPNEYIFKMIPLMIDATTFDEPSISNRFISMFKNKFSQIRSTNDKTVKASDLNQLLSTLFDNIINTKQQQQQQTGAKKDKSSAATEKEPINPSALILSGHAIYMIIRVLVSMKQASEVVAAPPKKTTAAKSTAAAKKNSTTPSEYGSLDLQLFTNKFDQIIESLLDRSNVAPTRFFTEFSQRFPAIIWTSIKKIVSILSTTQGDYNYKKILDVLSNIIKRKDSYGVNGKNLKENSSLIIGTLLESLSDQSKKLKATSVFDILNLISLIIQNNSLLDGGKNDVKAVIGSETLVALDNTLFECYKANNKQNIKDSIKRIIKLLKLEDTSKVFEMEKKAKSDKQQKKEIQHKEKIANKEKERKDMQEKIKKSREERKLNKSTDSKVDNKNKSRPKKKVEDSMEVVEDLDEIEVEKEEKAKVEKKSSSSNNNNNNSNNKDNNKTKSPQPKLNIKQQVKSTDNNTQPKKKQKK